MEDNPFKSNIKTSSAFLSPQAPAINNAFSFEETIERTPSRLLSHYAIQTCTAIRAFPLHGLTAILHSNFAAVLHFLLTLAFYTISFHFCLLLNESRSFGTNLTPPNIAKLSHGDSPSSSS